MSKEKKKEREREEPPIATSKVIPITESGKFLVVESASQGFGFGNLAQGFRIPTENGNPEYTRLNPESKTDSVYLTWGESTLRHPSKGGLVGTSSDDGIRRDPSRLRVVGLKLALCELVG